MIIELIVGVSCMLMNLMTRGEIMEKRRGRKLE